MFTRYNADDDKFEQVKEPDPSSIYTYADYLKWDFEERLELFRGKIFPLSAPNTKHQEISRNLLGTIFNLLQNNKCKIFSAPFDVRLPVKNKKRDDEITTVVQTDVCVICDETKLDERGCCGAPELVIEILSPGNTRKEVKIKHQLYEESGVQEYWLVYPAEENIAVFTLNDQKKFGGAQIYAYGDKIESKAVPGLTVSLKDVFIK